MVNRTLFDLDGFTCEPVQAVWITCHACGEAELLPEDTLEARKQWAQAHLPECWLYFEVEV